MLVVATVTCIFMKCFVCSDLVVQNTPVSQSWGLSRRSNRPFEAYLTERKGPYKTIVVLSGEHEYKKANVSESSLNGFPSGGIAGTFHSDLYRFLICADKFQTGYDEPLQHTMYVDKPLSGIKAMQTLSRLSRAYPKKHDVFVLGFQNNTEAITYAFQDYYCATLLGDGTDPNKLHDLKTALDAAQVYSPGQVEQFGGLFLTGADRDTLAPILDACAAVYVDHMGEDEQVEFKGKAKSFVRSYDFLSAVLPFKNGEWEKLSILPNLIIPKLPAPPDPGTIAGILEAIDMDSYRVEKKAVMRIALADEGMEIDPVPGTGGGGKPEPEMDRLGNILKSFNEHFGTLFDDADRVTRRIREDIAPKVAADAAYQNARANTPHTARMAHDHALGRVMQGLLKDDTQVYKQFVENEGSRSPATLRKACHTPGAIISSETAHWKMLLIDEAVQLIVLRRYLPATMTAMIVVNRLGPMLSARSCSYRSRRCRAPMAA